jgi:hypothetical protein
VLEDARVGLEDGWIGYTLDVIQPISPNAISVILSRVYGFAPSLIVPGALSLPSIHAAINPHPDAIPAVTDVARDPRVGRVVDNYA